MVFFHVVATFEDRPEEPVSVFMNLSDRDLKARFLKPYLRGEDLVSGNRILRVKSIRKVHIIRTERQSEHELANLQRKSRAEIEEINRKSRHAVFIVLGVGYKDEDIVHTGLDVTAQLISGPPGARDTVSRFSSLLNNGWVVTVGGGTLVAALVWWLGWH
jgi:hypothetical protein